MSDQTNPAGAGDFRGSAADKRKDETVMVNADDLSNLVSSARQDPVPPPAAPPVAPTPAAPSSGPPVALIAGILGVVALIIVIALIAMLAAR